MADSKLKQIRLVIADDQSIDLAGVKALLRDVQGIDVVGEADIATKVASVVSELKPNVLLLDLKWHGNSRMGLRLIEEVRQNSPEVKIIADELRKSCRRSTRRRRECGCHKVVLT
ncbi:MAG: response regulator transcription factor [Anaerolineales bacterium]|nr:response regulator transcription factor [Anaerolineales bacterium]